MKEETQKTLFKYKQSILQSHLLGKVVTKKNKRDGTFLRQYDPR